MVGIKIYETTVGPRTRMYLLFLLPRRSVQPIAAAAEQTAVVSSSSNCFIKRDDVIYPSSIKAFLRPRKQIPPYFPHLHLE